MRVALLSTLEPIADAGGDPRAFLPIAGRSVARHQLDCALALGCEKIACHAVGLSPDLVALQHAAERQGATFQIIQNARALSGLVKAADELVVFADGLLVDQAVVSATLDDRPAVLALLAEKGLAAGYERIDREYAWAGVFMVRGAAVERLADLSPDADPVSGLLRIALQSGTRMCPLPEEIIGSHRWNLVQNEEQARSVEAAWLDHNTDTASFAAPGLAMADRSAIALAARTGGPIVGRVSLLAGAAGLAGVAAVAGWFAEPVAAFAFAALAAVTGRVGQTLSAIDSIGRKTKAASVNLAEAITGILDILLIALVWLASAPAERISGLLAIITLIFALRLAVHLPLRPWKTALADRPILAVLLAAAVYFGPIVLIIQLLTLFALGGILIDTMRSRITRA